MHCSAHIHINIVVVSTVKEQMVTDGWIHSSSTSLLKIELLYRGCQLPYVNCRINTIVLLWGAVWWRLPVCWELSWVNLVGDLGHKHRVSGTTAPESCWNIRPWKTLKCVLAVLVLKPNLRLFSSKSDKGIYKFLRESREIASREDALNPNLFICFCLFVVLGVGMVVLFLVSPPNVFQNILVSKCFCTSDYKFLKFVLPVTKAKLMI